MLKSTSLPGFESFVSTENGSTEINLNTEIIANTTLNATYPPLLEGFVSTGNGLTESNPNTEIIANGTLNATFSPTTKLPVKCKSYLLTISNTSLLALGDLLIHTLIPISYT